MEYSDEKLLINISIVCISNNWSMQMSTDLNSEPIVCKTKGVSMSIQRLSCLYLPDGGVLTVDPDVPYQAGESVCGVAS